MIEKFAYKRIEVAPEPPRRSLPPERDSMAMLSPANAWRILCTRTGGSISLVTFYRWLRNGKVYSIRLGQKIFIPRPALEDLIKQCLAGERV